MSRLLDSLDRQRLKDFKIYLGDQSGGALDHLWGRHANLDLRIVPLPRSGVSSARNALTTLALTESPAYLAYPDDDCWYTPQTLELAAAALEDARGQDAILGTWGATPGSICNMPEGRIGRYSAFRRAETYVQFYRTSLVQKIGPWDETLGPGTGLPYGCGEDTDFLLRALELSDRITRRPEVQVYHPLPRLGGDMAKKWREYALGRMHLLEKHKFPLYFRLANVAWPLLRMPLERPSAWPYRAAMFLGRLEGLAAAKRRS